ncbi:MAG TPA: poly-gamma-glutamate hydrolase family protein [Vicinamibacteria bacterium]|nr:poly-gamma-glutamate hydrolase family protein [Vicinamibacteria bacterium]
MRLTEQLLGKGATGLAVLAPHGGKIESGTDDQATSVFQALAQNGKPVRAWIARGFHPRGAHRCWHITASEISERSFPRLGSLFGPGASRGPFAHAVAFHGQNDSEAIVVGGGLPRDAAHTALKMTLGLRIRDALRAVMEDPPAVVVKRSGPLAGIERANIVNRITAAGNGIQVEQPAAVRTVNEPRDAIAQAVAAFYVDLI